MNSDRQTRLSRSITGAVAACPIPAIAKDHMLVSVMPMSTGTTRLRVFGPRSLAERYGSQPDDDARYPERPAVATVAGRPGIEGDPLRLPRQAIVVLNVV